MDHFSVLTAFFALAIALLLAPFLSRVSFLNGGRGSVI